MVQHLRHISTFFIVCILSGMFFTTVLASAPCFAAVTVTSSGTVQQPSDDTAQSQQQGESGDVNSQGDLPRRILLRSGPNRSGDAPVITPSTALRDGAPGTVLPGTVQPGTPQANATEPISVWSAKTIRSMLPYNNATGPAPGSESMPRLAPLR